MKRDKKKMIGREKKKKGGGRGRALWRRELDLFWRLCDGGDPSGEKKGRQKKKKKKKKRKTRVKGALSDVRQRFQNVQDKGEKKKRKEKKKKKKGGPA